MKIVLLFICLFSLGCGGSDDDYRYNGGYRDDDDYFDCSGIRTPQSFPSGVAGSSADLIGDWECRNSRGNISKQSINSEGTYSVESNFNDYPKYQNHIEVWRKCRHGTRPPDFRGTWRVYADSPNRKICFRTDLFPNQVACRPLRII